MRLLALLAAFALALPAVAQDLVAKTDALSPADELKKFKLPEGFTAQLVASEPDIQKPMQLAFDAKGRMWVTTSHHYPWTAEGGKGTDKLFVLSDFDANGKAKKVTVFDDKLNIPIGVLPLPDCKSVIVSECGKILKLTDTDDDGKADKREVLFEGFGFKDTHGMTNSFTLLPDGWVYACHGFANDSKVKGKDGHEVTMNSGHTFRFKPDGSRIEIFTRGQVNPFGIAVDPWLNLYTADCHSKPVTQLIRGAYYDSFGKPHDGLGYAPHVYSHLHNSTGLCGVVYYAADHFPKEWNGVLFLGNVVTSRINVDRVDWKGSTPVGKELADFLVSDDPWFRPVDIKLGPDGALYVSDFYNKIIGHYEVDLKHPGRDKDRGRVWRIVYTGKDGKAAVPGVPDTNWADASARKLLEGMSAPNLTVQLLAANEAAGRKDFCKEVKSVTEKTPPDALLHFVAERTLKLGFNDPDDIRAHITRGREVRVMQREAVLGVKAFAGRAEWGEGERNVADRCLTAEHPRVQLAAVQLVAEHPHPQHLRELFNLANKMDPEDTHLRHAVRIALRNCIQSFPPDQKLFLMSNFTPGDYIRRDALAEALVGCTDPRALAQLALMVSQDVVPNRLAADAGRQLGRHGNAATWSSVGIRVSNNPNTTVAHLGLFGNLCRGVQERGYKPGTFGEAADKEFGDMLARGLATANSAMVSDKPAVRAAALELFREVRRTIPNDWCREPDLHVNMPVAVFRDKIAAREQRVMAAEVLFLYRHVSGQDAVREAVALVEPNSQEQSRLLSLLLTGTPTVADHELAASHLKTAPYAQAVSLAGALAGDKLGADLLLVSIGKGEAPARLLQEKAVVDRLKATNVKDLDEKLKELTKNIPPAEKRVEDLLKARTAGFPKAKTDVAKGKAVFTKNCAVCHQLNNEGAKVGPQLDGIGIRGSARLMEDTLDPNRNVDHTFRATKLELKDGQSLTGLVREDGAVYVLVDGTGKEQRVPTADVDKKTTSNLSAMPANLDTVMKEDEYYHLLAFLLEQKAKK